MIDSSFQLISSGSMQSRGVGGCVVCSMAAMALPKKPVLVRSTLLLQIMIRAHGLSRFSIPFRNGGPEKKSLSLT